ncbi:hypothetical protein C1H69_03140 [Billgrantia endophytica]|uniref:Uncharacterized protein n=1 Tax=Billgrantia endophytica TaxID=2033802 RepID=A0A2N7UAV9_9GAMM|nr:hypothetical protein C1H69_03140 [Halomonas endophytica]
MSFTGAALPIVLLAGCTTYTFDDGSRETLWGVPAEEEARRHEDDRQAEGVRYRVPGEVEEPRPVNGEDETPR